MSFLTSNCSFVHQETQTSLSGSPPYNVDSPSNSYHISQSHINNANSDLMTGISNLCAGQNTGNNIGEDGIMSQEFRHKLVGLFRQIELEFEKECKRIYTENYTIPERGEKLESSDHEEMNIAKKISGSHLSQKIKQQYKQSKQSTSRFVSTLRDKGNTGSSGGGGAPMSGAAAVSHHSGGSGSGGLTGTGGMSSSTRQQHSASIANLCWRVSEHRDGIWEVNCVGRALVGTACADGIVRMWNAENGHCVLVYLGHSGSVNSVRFKNGLMLTASGDGTAHLISLPLDKLVEDTASIGTTQNKSVIDCTTGTEEEIPMADEQSSIMVNNARKSNLTYPVNMLEESLESGDTNAPPIILRNPNSLYQTASFYAGHPDPSPSVALGSSTNATALTYQDSAPLSAADFFLSRNQIVTASWDRLGRIYDVTTGSEVSSLTGHDQPLTDVRTTPMADHSLAVTSSRDCTFRLWDFRCSSTDVHVQQGHNGTVSSVNFVGQSGEKLISAGADRYCKLWDLRHHRNPLKEFRTDSPINRIALHPAGKVIALPMDNRTIKIIELNMGNRIARFPRHSNQNHSRIVTNVCWTADGSGKPNLYSVGFDHQLLAWHLQLPAALTV